MKARGLSRRELFEVGADVLEKVPRYSLGMNRPLDALELGIGDCAATSLIASALIKLRYGMDVHTIYNAKKHGEEEVAPSKISPTTRQHIEHIDVLVPGDDYVANGDRYDIQTLAFGMHVVFNSDTGYQEDRRPKIENVNEGFGADEAFAVIEGDGSIVPGPGSIEYGLAVEPWKQGFSHYFNQLNTIYPDYDQLEQVVKTTFDT